MPEHEDRYRMIEQTDNTTVCSLEELRGIVMDFARKRGFKGAWIFGGYARGESDGNSDIDVLVDRENARALTVCEPTNLGASGRFGGS